MLTNIAKDTLYHGYKLRATKFLNHNLQSTIGGVTMSFKLFRAPEDTSKIEEDDRIQNN